MVSWAHQRTRELADQLLDDAHTFRQRCTDCAAGLRRAGLAAVDAILDVPTVCRDWLRAFALVGRRAGTNAAAATLDARWVVAESIGRMRPGRHDDDD